MDIEYLVWWSWFIGPFVCSLHCISAGYGFNNFLEKEAMMEGKVLTARWPSGEGDDSWFWHGGNKDSLLLKIQG
jgi:hypothetical protein